ncbi:GIY-YIG nuclease family protein [Streptomyces lavendulocolor]|uniref:GIY-YIG nuclease family protein n=1 Tax=Streptomyces lavendulocolor TaxID=67316 RepID=UPI0033F33856
MPHEIEGAAPSCRQGANWMKQVPLGLYPTWMPARLYLGTAGSCRRKEPGYYYVPSDWESERVTLIETLVVWTAPKKVNRPQARRRRASSSIAERTALYRLRNSAGRLLYVGISSSPQRRWVEHSIDKPWWPEVSDLSLEWHGSRGEALDAEMEAIRSERPLYNVQHNQAIA